VERGGGTDEVSASAFRAPSPPRNPKIIASREKKKIFKNPL